MEAFNLNFPLFQIGTSNYFQLLYLLNDVEMFNLETENLRRSFRSCLSCWGKCNRFCGTYHRWSSISRCGQNRLVRWRSMENLCWESSSLKNSHWKCDEIRLHDLTHVDRLMGIMKVWGRRVALPRYPPASMFIDLEDLEDLESPMKWFHWNCSFRMLKRQ